MKRKTNYKATRIVFANFNNESLMKEKQRDIQMKERILQEKLKQKKGNK